MERVCRHIFWMREVGGEEGEGKEKRLPIETLPTTDEPGVRGERREGWMDEWDSRIPAGSMDSNHHHRFINSQDHQDHHHHFLLRTGGRKMDWIWSMASDSTAESDQGSRTDMRQDDRF